MGDIAWYYTKDELPPEEAWVEETWRQEKKEELPFKFSASDLVKRSASQILYFMLKREQYKVTDRMRKGTEYQDKVATSQFLEMRGIHKFREDAAIFFTWDEIYPGYPLTHPTVFIEIKMVDNMQDYEDWYLESSILQTAFYGAMSKECDDYYTAKFARKKLETKYLDTKGTKKQFRLHFGTDQFLVQGEKEALLDHFTKKAHTIIDGFVNSDFEKVRNWDKRFKFKDFKKLKRKLLWEKESHPEILTS